MSKNLAGLPHGWQLVRLGDYSLKTNQKDPTKQSDKTFIYIDVSSVSNKSFRITNYKEIQGKDAPSRARKIIRANDAIFATVRPTLKRIALIPEVLDNQICSTGFCVIRANQTYLDSGFIYYFLLSEYVANRVDNLQKGATYPAISDSDLYDLEIPLMSLEEQRAIATTLRTIQTAKEARQKELALERERKAALMDYLFTHGTRNELRKQTELGEISESWEILSFEKVVNITNGQVKPFEKPYIDMLHVGSENIESNTGRLMNLKTNREIKVISGNYYFNKQNILYSKIRPYLNKVAVPEFEGTCSADIYPLSPNESFLSRDFLFQLLLSERFLKQAIKFQERTGIPKINRNQLGMIELTIPSLEEQQEIAEILSSCDAKIATLEREIKLHDELFRAMLEELMTEQLSSLPLA